MFTVKWWMDAAVLGAGAGFLVQQYGWQTGLGLGLLAYFIGSRSEPDPDK